MKKQDKIFTVDNLTAQLKEAKSIVLTDYRGLNVAQMAQLRQQIKKAGGEMTVVKNSLLERALANLDLEIPEEEMVGPTAIVIATADQLAPLKAVSLFAKNTGLPAFKAGIWEDRVLGKNEIERLSLLPSKEELLGRLVALLSSPTVRLVHVITNNPQKLILLLKKMEGGEQEIKN